MTSVGAGAAESGPGAAGAGGNDRCRCGRTIEVGHRYCPACGAGLDGSHGGDPGSPPGPAGDGSGGAVVFDTGSEPVTVDGSVRVGGVGPRARLVVLGGLALVTLAGWALLRSSGTEVSVAPPAADAETGAEVADDAGREADAPSAGSSDPLDAGREADAPSAGSSDPLDAPGDQRSETSSGSDEGAPGGSPAGRPVIGEPTGLSLALGHWDEVGVTILDLDTGAARSIDGVRGVPLGLVATTLVVVGHDGRPLLVDLAEPDPEAKPLDTLSVGGGVDVAELTDDRIWLAEQTTDAVVYRAYDPAGQLMEEVEIERSDIFGLPLIAPGSGLVYDPGGGLYRRRPGGRAGDEFELVVTGQVLGVGERLALVRRCDAARECRVRWFDLEVDDYVEVPTPDLGDALDVAYRLVGGDRWLVRIDWRTGDLQLIEVAASRPGRDLGRGLGLGPFGAFVGLSGDGRWLHQATADAAVVVDLDSGTEWPLGPELDDLLGSFIVDPS